MAPQERWELVLRRRAEGAFLREIAVELGVSASRALQIERRARRWRISQRQAGAAISFKDAWTPERQWHEIQSEGQKSP